MEVKDMYTLENVTVEEAKKDWCRTDCSPAD